MNNQENFCSVFKRRADAVAFVEGSKKYPELQGRVMFYGLSDAVLVQAEFIGLPTSSEPCGQPIFAFHIHQNGNCEDTLQEPFANTGGHYNPKNCPHPYHAGDLPPIFSANGRAFSVFLTNRFSVPEVLGRSIVLHAEPDDFKTQPSGAAGEKIACGSITPTAR